MVQPAEPDQGGGGVKSQSPAVLITRPTPGMKRDRDSGTWDFCIGMPLSTRRSFTRRTPRGLFGSIGLMAVHSDR